MARWTVGGAQWGTDPADKTRLGRYLDSKWGCLQQNNGTAAGCPVVPVKPSLLLEAAAEPIFHATGE
jgi:hypothetical protein